MNIVELTFVVRVMTKTYSVRPVRIVLHGSIEIESKTKEDRKYKLVTDLQKYKDDIIWGAKM